MAQVYLSPSDQTDNVYAYGNTVEAAQCRRIADACEAALTRCGIGVRNNQTDSMERRVAQSNTWGADLHVCIHTNAYNGEVTGTRVFCWDLSGKGYEAAQAIFGELAPLTPGTSDSIAVNQTWYDMRKTQMPCVYLEVEFHDNAGAAKWIVEHTEQIGETIARGICRYFGIAYVPPAQGGSAGGSSGVLYRVQVGAYAVRENAERMLRRLKAAGFDGFIAVSDR